MKNIDSISFIPLSFFSISSIHFDFVTIEASLCTSQNHLTMPTPQEHFKAAYTFEKESLFLGGAMLENEAVTGCHINIPLETLNRHGLISGATGTGKTKTLQIIAQKLSQHGVPSLVMDMKGDLSGVAAASAGHPKIDERHEKIGSAFEASAAPVEFLSLSDEPGVRLRVTILELGPILFSRMLGLNETQSSNMAMIFAYCDKQEMPLVDLEDIKAVLRCIADESNPQFVREYGHMSSTSAATMIRKIIEIESQGVGQFFGEPSFDVFDLCRTDSHGQGIISILRLTDIQDRSKLFSAFLLSLLAEVYTTFPEAGDMDKPKLVLFFDEAHLIFKHATSELIDQLEQIIKLIRSKGVGIIFCTQNPEDVPAAILSQLGLKIQHALRAFTAADRKKIKRVADNYPISEYYDVEELITSLGIGEALVTALDRKGRPTPLVHTLLCAPPSRMDVLSPAEITKLINQSHLIGKYKTAIDRESAHEMLADRVGLKSSKKSGKTVALSTEDILSMAKDILSHPIAKQISRDIARELTRTFLGALGIKKNR